MFLFLLLMLYGGIACAQKTFNPDLSLSAMNAAAWHSGDEALLPGGHDPGTKGFQLQNAELILSKSVDPYFESQMNLNFGLAGGESYVEMEELWVRSMPILGATVKAGQFFTSFGRFNPLHPHSWRFSSQALTVSSLMGSEGLRGLGTEVEYLIPTGFYWNLKGSLQMADGMPVFRGEAHHHDHGEEIEADLAEETVPYEVNGLEDLVASLRTETSFDLTPAASILLGASYALGPNNFHDGSGLGTTHLSGFDAYFRWQPADARLGFPFFSWQTESIGRFQIADEIGEDWGVASEAAWGFDPRWSVGLRGEVIAPFHDHEEHEHVGEEPTGPKSAEEAWRGGVNLTFYPSEYSSIRLEYSAGAHQEEETVHSIILQLGVSLGAHGAHQF